MKNELIAPFLVIWWNRYPKRLPPKNVKMFQIKENILSFK